MNRSYLIYLILVTIAISSLCGCMANSEHAAPLLPEKNLPEGYKFIGKVDASTKGADIADEIKEFYGSEDIGPVNATHGYYSFGPMNETYNNYITLIQTRDSGRAKAAESNYLSQEEFRRPLPTGWERFTSAVVNGHNVTEIRVTVRGERIRYLYLWTKESIVILVEGNEDRSKSLELASATGL